MASTADGGCCVAVPWGGYARAERTRIAIVRSDLEATVKDADQVRKAGIEANLNNSVAAHVQCLTMLSLLPIPMPRLYQALLSQLDGVRALNVVGNFTFDAATHPDFLGACLGTGMQVQLQVHALHPCSCCNSGCRSHCRIWRIDKSALSSIAGGRTRLHQTQRG